MNDYDRYQDKYSDWEDEEVTVFTRYDTNAKQYVFDLELYLDSCDLEGYSKEEYIKMYIK
jgi:hypothetical protein